MHSLRLGQTERGSFIIRVMAPIPPAPILNQVEITPTPTIERKVTEQMLRTLRALSATANEALSAPPAHVRTLFGAAAKEGVTAALCDALVYATRQPGTSAVDARVSWAGTVPRESWEPTEVRFDARLAPVFEAGALALRSHEPPAVLGVEGWVVHLHREPNDDVGGDAIILALLGGTQPRQVRVRLPESEYHKALSAHREGKVVNCMGVVTREGKRFVIREPGEFRILNDQEAMKYEDND
jgi:hypothetical protein